MARQRNVAAALVGVTLLGVACAGARPPDPRYRPAQTVLEVVATLRRHVPDDTYRFEPARDFTGRNIYRATLIRLENLERAHGAALRAGHLDEVIAFAKGRALERLRAFALAAASYRRAAEQQGPLRHEALRSAAICDALDEASRIGFEPDRPLRPGEASKPAPADPKQMLADYDRRLALLEALLADVRGTHYEAVVREEIEHADVARARYFVARRHLDPDGNVRAISELERVVTRHRDSKNERRHRLELADLYATLAEEYVAARPPESLDFDPPTFEELVDSAARLYESVASEDGTPEKLEAARRLEAFLAFTLRVDRDRLAR